MQKKDLSKLVLTTLLTGSVLWGGGQRSPLKRICRSFPWTLWLLPQPEPRCQ